MDLTNAFSEALLGQFGEYGKLWESFFGQKRLVTLFVDQPHLIEKLKNKLEKLESLEKPGLISDSPNLSSRKSDEDHILALEIRMANIMEKLPRRQIENEMLQIIHDGLYQRSIEPYQTIPNEEGK